MSPSRGFWSCQVSGLQDSRLKPVSFCFPSAGQDPPCACVCVRVLCVRVLCARVLCVCAMCVCYVCVCYVRMCYVCVCYVCVMCACVKCACVMCACACRGSHHPCHFQSFQTFLLPSLFSHHLKNPFIVILMTLSRS